MPVLSMAIANAVPAATDWTLAVMGTCTKPV